MWRFDPEVALERLARGELAGADLDMRIDRHGTWLYQGSPIERMALVRLLAGALRRAPDGTYWLITPFERWRVTVDDAPYLAVELRRERRGKEQHLLFRTNVDEWVEVDSEHRLAMRGGGGASGPVPYVQLDGGLEARVVQSVFYELAELAESEPARPDRLGVRSAGHFFPLVRDPDGSDG